MTLPGNGDPPADEPDPVACSGTERHRHYRFESGRHLWHSHQHTTQVGESSNLHHHPPGEHDGLSFEELIGGVPEAQHWIWR